MKKTLTLALLLTSSVFCFAQTKSEALLKKLVEKEIITESDANEVLVSEKETVVTPNGELIQKMTSLFNNNYIRVGGYSQLLLDYNDVRPVKTNFGVRTAFIGLSGQPAKNLNYFFLYNARANAITDMHVTWTPDRVIGLRAGLQKAPLGIEYNMALSQIELIQTTYMTRYLFAGPNDVFAKKAGGSTTGRDMGFNVFGDIYTDNGNPILSYALAIFQGTGLAGVAHTNKKDFSTAVYLKPITGLKVGGGIYAGSAFYDLGYGENSTKESHVRNRWIVSAEYKTPQLTLRSEFAQGNDAGTKLQSSYILGAYYVAPKVQLVGQFDWMRTNTKSSAHMNGYTAGITYYSSKWSKLMLNYVYTDFSKAWDQKNSNGIEAQVVILY